MDFKQGELLKSVDNPKDLKKLNTKNLPQFCNELRDYIVEWLQSWPESQIVLDKNVN